MPALDRMEPREGVRAVHPCVLRPPVELASTQRRAQRSAYLADREAGGRYGTLDDHGGPKPLACAGPAEFPGGLAAELEDDL